MFTVYFKILAVNSSLLDIPQRYISTSRVFPDTWDHWLLLFVWGHRRGIYIRINWIIEVLEIKKKK